MGLWRFTRLRGDETVAKIGHPAQGALISARPKHTSSRPKRSAVVRALFFVFPHLQKLIQP